MTGNLLYAQSGGVTAVINASAAGVIAEARLQPERIGRVLAARNGILGVLRETLVDTASLLDPDLRRLRATPGGAFGSCRFDLDPEASNPAQYARLFAVLAAHDVRYFLYNGGNGSMETCRQVQAAADARGYALIVVGVPKTVDNDIVGTDCCPGYGSAAKYLATSVREVGLDLAAMTTNAGRAFVLEVMGRNAGWLAAACGLAAEDDSAAPHLILLPEVPFDEARFLERVRDTVARWGHCSVVVAEGLRRDDGQILSMQDRSQKGYVQLGGAGEVVRVGRGPGAGAVDADGVVGVLAVGDVRESLPLGDVVADAREQFVLAVEAAVGTVGHVGRSLTLVRLDLDHARPEVCGHGVRRLPLVGREARRDAEQGHDVVAAELAIARASRVAESTPPE